MKPGQPQNSGSHGRWSIARRLGSRFKYSQRFFHFALLEAGHIAQNICLTMQSLGLGTRPIGEFLDDEYDAKGEIL